MAQDRVKSDINGFLVGAVIGTVISVAGLLGTSHFCGQDTGEIVEQAQEAALPYPVVAPSRDSAPVSAILQKTLTR
ncbi:hypothetical protein LSUCC0387_06150 [Rhodobacterales bacterium LSUCC0387]|nr:hypothetical protein [Rhodobacterales bacterium LSUCC0387]